MCKDMKKAGITYLDKDGRRLDFHSLRHTYATNLSKAGVPPRVAMEMMRHSDIKLTMKTYTDGTQLPVAEALNKLPWLGAVGSSQSQGTEIRTEVLVQNGQKPSQTGNLALTGDSSNTEVSVSVCQGKSQAVSKNPNNQNVEPWDSNPPRLPYKRLTTGKLHKTRKRQGLKKGLRWEKSLKLGLLFLIQLRSLFF
jgi:hypothetical protein